MNKVYSIRVTPEVAKTRPQNGGRRNVAVFLTFDVHPVVWLGPLPPALAQDTGLHIEELSGHAATTALERPVSGISVLAFPRPARPQEREVRQKARGAPEASESADRAALEAEYLRLTGQKPRLLRDETLRQKVAEAQAAEAEAQGTQGTE